MNRRALIVLSLAAIFGLLTAVLVHRTLSTSPSAQAGQKTKKVVVAAVKLGLGTQIKAEQVSLAEWPESLLPRGNFTEVEKLVGRVTIAEIFPGEPILETRLAPEGSAAGLPAIIPPGMRAMTVKVDEVIGVAGFVAPGTYVDVVGTVVEGTGQNAISRVILQNVKVLASGQRMETQKDGQAIEVKTVTLQVTPEEAEILALASNAGKLQLVMRNTVDREMVQTKGVDEATLFRGALARTEAGSKAVTENHQAIARSSKRKTEMALSPEALSKTTIIELIRGSERTTITFQ
ncbi:MAG: Flp pilus assembly protein CpaB [Blastocatellia bacterium]|nr:Flp pilus assembly protein CpaB [Blastocatellia bacterium]